MADVTVTPELVGLNTVKTFDLGANNGEFGVAVSSANVAVIENWSPTRDTILIRAAGVGTSPVKAVSGNVYDRTNDQEITTAAADAHAILPNTLPREVFMQSDGSLRIDPASTTIYVRVLRGPVTPL